ncbi:MAG: mechanosensitive ion channel, partial [Gammaproteobacteria bacterium]
MDKITHLFENVNFTGLLTTWGGNLLLALVIMIVGRWIARILGHVSDRLMQRARLDATLSHFVARVLVATITVIAVIAGLNQLGVETTSLVAVVGAAGLAVGLAMKDSLSNFAAGAMLMVFRPFKAGDFVDAGGASGTVEEVSIFHTVICTGGNQIVTVPNANVYGNNITNYSARATRRMDIAVGIDYDDDIALARRVIHEVIAADTRLLAEPAPIVWVTDFGDNSINLSVRVWAKATDYWDARSDLLEAI